MAYFPMTDIDGTDYYASSDGYHIDLNFQPYIPVAQRPVTALNNTVTSNNKSGYSITVTIPIPSKPEDSLLSEALSSQPKPFDPDTFYHSEDYLKRAEKAYTKAGAKDVCWNKRYRNSLVDLGLTLQPYYSKNALLAKKPVDAPECVLTSDYPWQASIIVAIADDRIYSENV